VTLGVKDVGKLQARGPLSEGIRTLFVSDVHLGTRACQAEALIAFLKCHDAGTIYLVGDIVDFWRVKRGAAWPQSHNDVVQKLLRKVRKGARIIFIPGNHDEALRDYCGTNFGGIEIHHDFMHETADGRRLLVMHGDEFDVVVKYAKWLAFLGDRSYEFALWCNGPLNWIRRHLGFGYWSLSAYLKLRVKSAVNFIGEFEHAIATEAKRRGADGVVCGHIHHAADKLIEGIRYINCGDWVESCTAIAEDHDGRLHLIQWEPGAIRRLGKGRPPISMPGLSEITGPAASRAHHAALEA
jgi:UDP-2,3-diacylglucosamine pyrophosphatase LpxH